MTFDALGAAPLLADTPLLVIHGKIDAYCSPELAAELHENTGGDREIVWLDCDRHIDLYDMEPTSPRPPGPPPPSCVACGGAHPAANGADPRRCIR
jgi:fermentation-respiration switch protein FrsA (DUF1100 family)